MVRWIISCIMVSLLSIVLPGQPQSVAPPSVHSDGAQKVHGMTISCPRAGQIWGTDAMVATMTELKGMGVNWVAIHPYAGISADGTIGGRMNRLYEDPSWLTRPIQEAHALGLKIMIKPHIAYWGSPFSWRGKIRFHDPEAWERFFTSYERWIVHVAELSRDADAFVVGTELDGTTHHEAQWRSIIAAVRSKTDKPITFASNWDQFERVPFWDALDVIGIQSYFPLVNHADPPGPGELERAWKKLAARLDKVSTHHGKPILLAELGYSRSDLAASRPWEHHSGGEHGEAIQQQCMAVALKAIDESDAIIGAFLWKWFPGEQVGRRGDFVISTPAMRGVIEDAWKIDGAASSPSAPSSN